VEEVHQVLEIFLVREAVSEQIQALGLVIFHVDVDELGEEGKMGTLLDVALVLVSLDVQGDDLDAQVDLVLILIWSPDEISTAERFIVGTEHGAGRGVHGTVRGNWMIRHGLVTTNEEDEIRNSLEKKKEKKEKEDFKIKK